MSQQINLYFEQDRKGGDGLSALKMMQGLGWLLLVAALLYGYGYYMTSALQQELGEQAVSLAAEQKRLDKLATDYSRQRSGMTLEQELTKTAAEVAAQKDIINALQNGVIGNTGGFSGYMQAFARQVVNGLWLTGFTIEGNGTQMSISGATISPDLVPGYILRLSKEEILRGRRFASLQMQVPQEEPGKTSQGQYLEFILQTSAEGGDGQ